MKIKYLAALLVLAVMLLSGCANNTTDAAVPDGMKLFSNEHTDYTAYIPSLWEQDVSTAFLSARVPTSNSNISITTITLGAEDPKTLEDYWKKYEEEFKSTLGDMEYIGKHPQTFKLSGEDAHKYVYTATVTGEEYQFMQVVCIRNNNAYVITFTSTVEDYEEYAEDVDQIISNFSFNK